jgi:predicted Co/Zn/Cd cation transporter (cation efflux family)
MRGHAERIDSGLVRLDVKSWFMSALVTTALLIAFGLALALEGTDAEWLVSYVDPAVLALLSLVLLPMPFREARESLAEILGLSPPEIDAQVNAVMADFIARHGFPAYRSYVSKAGRARFIEISVLVSPSLTLPMAEIDDLRAEIGEAIGAPGPDRWLTIVFTADPAQL